MALASGFFFCRSLALTPSSAPMLLSKKVMSMGVRQWLTRAEARKPKPPTSNKHLDKSKPSKEHEGGDEEDDARETASK